LIAFIERVSSHMSVSEGLGGAVAFRVFCLEQQVTTRHHPPDTLDSQTRSF